MEVQLGQLAISVGRSKKGQFPSQTIPNPKVQPNAQNALRGQFGIDSSPGLPHDEVQAIHTLRSGKQVDNQVRMSEEKNVNVGESNKDKGQDVQKKGEVNQAPIENHPVKPYIPKAPYPHRLQDNRKNKHFEGILEVFKNVQINIPLLDAIKQIPSYSKFLKDLTTLKRKTSVPREAVMAAQASGLIQQTIVPKYKDPGCPTISIRIGDTMVDKCLLDLGASVNLLPYSVYKQLGLGELKPTDITLSLADRSVKVPKGIVEDVIVKVNEFYFPADFVVLDTKPVMNPGYHIPVILGRPFFATSDAVIRCRNGVMTLAFGNKKLKLNVFNNGFQYLEMDDEEEVNMIDVLIG